MSVAVLVNLRSRGGSESIARLVRSMLPRARIAVTRSLDEAREWIQREILPNPPSLLLSGGGDGTAVSLLTELRATGVALPPIGLVPLGTGNGWANVTGAPRPRRAFEAIASLEGQAPPLRRFSLVEVEGRLTPFAGTGWDAELVNDYQKQLAALPAALREKQSPMVGYMRGLFTKTIPRHLFGYEPAQVRLIDLGGDAHVVDANGCVQRIVGDTRGRVLHEGPVSVAGAGTSTELGLGFKAFPFAHALPGHMAVRVYGATPMEATRNLRRLWNGEHPMPHSHDYLLTRCRMELDRPVPVEVGGDVIGDRTSIDFAIADERVDLVDWSRLRAA